MRDYEIVFIFNSALDRSAVDQKLERFNKLVTGNGGGEVTAVEHWGKRQLAYRIKKHDNGYYVVVQVQASPDRLPEFERAVRLDEDVLRYLVVLSEGELPRPGSSATDAGAADRSEDEGERE